MSPSSVLPALAPHAAAVQALTRQYSDTTVLMHDAIARHAGLSGADHKYLGLLMQHGSLTAGEWARLTGLTTGAVTGLIDRLERKQLVQRTADAHDRRKQVIVPNVAQAQQLLGGVFGELQAQTAALLATLSEAEAAAVSRYFQAAIDIMQQTTRQLTHPQ